MDSLKRFSLDMLKGFMIWVIILALLSGVLFIYYFFNRTPWENRKISEEAKNYIQDRYCITNFEISPLSFQFIDGWYKGDIKVKGSNSILVEIRIYPNGKVVNEKELDIKLKR